MVSNAKPTYISFITDKLNIGIVDPKDIISDFCSKFHKTERTFWNQWKIAKSKWEILHEAKEKAKNDAIVDNETNGLKSGLKSKLEKQLSLQKQIEEIEKILDDGETPDTIIDVKTSSSFDITRKITAIERSHLMKTLRELTAELNKMAGDYAPAKQDITTNGKDLPQTTIQIGYGPKRKD